MACLLFLVSGKPADAKAVLTAHAQFFLNLKSDIGKRNKNMRYALTGTGNGIYKILLPVQYFIFNRRTFTDLR
jgi:hypothetical protein